MERKNYIYKIDFNGVWGTGFLFYVFDNGLGLVLTAGHCLKEIKQGDREGCKNIRFESGIKAVRIFRGSEKMDVAILIVKLEKGQIGIDWQISSEETINSAYIHGYPVQKCSEKNYYDCMAGAIQYDEGQGLYVGKVTEPLDPDRNFLLQGMSGAPVYNKDTKELYGIYLGSQEDNGRYDEYRILPIQRIMEFACDSSIIYYKKFEFKEGIGLYDAKMRYWDVFKEGLEMVNLKKFHELKFLLIGKSGNGKSAFIKSFLKHSKLLATTGEGRTTRVNCEYEVKYSGIQEDFTSCVNITFLNKREFKQLRLRQAQKNIEACEAIREKGDKGELLNALWDALCTIKGFFNIEEFDPEKLGMVENKFEEIFGKIDLNLNDCLTETEGSAQKDGLKPLVDYAETFYEEMYDILNQEEFFKTRKIELRFDMPEVDKEFIELCFRNVNKDDTSLSYSGMVKRIKITDRLCDQYAELFEGLEIGSVTYIDTYGLDHETNDNEEVEERLKELLYNVYPDVKNVLYIRKLNADSPNDLEFYLPTLYHIDANVILNVVFTEIDKNDNFVKAYKDNPEDVNLLELNIGLAGGNSAVQYFGERKNGSKYGSQVHPLQKSIDEMVRSKSFAEAIFRYIVDNLTPYCASEKEEEACQYHENNLRRLEKLFRAVIRKEHMGTGIINTDYILKYFREAGTDQESSFRQTLGELLERLFKEASMEWTIGNYHRGHWKTKMANVNALKRGELGYYGVHDDQWSSSFKSAYNTVFARLDNEEFYALFAENKNSAQGVMVQRLLNEFIIEMTGCRRWKSDYFMCYNAMCRGCAESCFRKALLAVYPEGCFQEEATDHAAWLNERCNFLKKYKEHEEELMQYFLETLKGLEAKFEEHNRKRIGEILNSDTAIQEDIQKIRQDIQKIKQDIQKKLGTNGERYQEEIRQYINKSYTGLY